MLARSWTCVGRLTELGLREPARLAVVDVLGESVLLTVDKAGALHGYYNVCRHRGSQVVPVDPGSPAPVPCRSFALRCPYHSWTYDLDGSLRYAPHTEDVDDFAGADFGLHPVAVDAWGGFVWVNLDPSPARTLADELGPVPERVRRYPLDELVVGRRMVYDVAANWKVVAENYNECYHCGPVHPELVRLVPAFGRGGSRPGLGRRRRAPRGCVDLHVLGHVGPRVLPRARRGRAGAAQGRAGVPEPAAVAVRRARRRVPAAAARGRPHRDRLRRAGRRPTRWPGTPSTSPTPPTSGTS